MYGPVSCEPMDHVDEDGSTDACTHPNKEEPDCGLCNDRGCDHCPGSDECFDVSCHICYPEVYAVTRDSDEDPF